VALSLCCCRTTVQCQQISLYIARTTCHKSHREVHACSSWRTLNILFETLYNISDSIALWVTLLRKKQNAELSCFLSHTIVAPVYMGRSQYCTVFDTLVGLHVPVSLLYWLAFWFVTRKRNNNSTRCCTFSWRQQLRASLTLNRLGIAINLKERMPSSR